MAIGWGVIGAGGIASRRTIPEGIIPARGAKLAAVMDIDPSRARAVGERFGVPWHSELQPLMAHGDIQAVYIATPTVAHAPQALAAIAAGKHILVEKPLAMNVADARRIAAAARRKGVVAATGFMMRHHGAHVKMKQLIERGVIGKPVLGRAQLSCWYPPMMEGAWRQDPKLGGGGSFIDMGNHCFDLLEMFLGRTVEVHAFTANLVHDYKSEDTALVTLRFESGALGVVDNLFNVPDEASKNVLELYGSGGSIRCEGTIGQAPGGVVRLVSAAARGYDARQQRSPSRERVVRFRQVNTYRAEIEDFTRAIRRGTRPAVPVEDGIWNMRVVEAAYRSARTGRRVRP